MAQNEVRLSAEMQEIVTAALAAGLGGSGEEVVLLALRALWSDHLASTAYDRVQVALREAAADTRPGRSVDAVFARLRELSERKPAERADAA